MSLDVLKANRIVGQVDIEGTETLMDPVSKFRVSNPQNLIDTDFEYGLQTTKWETIELINNIPTFFRREGDATIQVSDMRVNAGSDIVTVQCTVDHNLSVGNPIIVKGATNIIADGTYIVLSVLSTTSFTYQARKEFPLTNSIIDLSTEVYSGALYQGTEFKLDGLGSVEIDDSSPSNIIVTTLTPHGFATGTTFILVNSLVSATYTFGPDNIDTNILLENEITTTLEEVPTKYLLTNNYFDTSGIPAVITDAWTTLFQAEDGVTDPVDTGVYSIDLISALQVRFEIFGAPYSYVHLTPDGYVIFNNNASYTGGSTIGDPPTSLGGFPFFEVFPNDYELLGLHYRVDGNSLAIRYEAKPTGSVTFDEDNPGVIWEMVLDFADNQINFKMFRLHAEINNTNFTSDDQVSFYVDSGDGQFRQKLTPAQRSPIFAHVDTPSVTGDEDHYDVGYQLIPREFWNGSAWEFTGENYPDNPNVGRFKTSIGNQTIVHTDPADFHYYKGDMFTKLNFNRYLSTQGRRDLFPNSSTAAVSTQGRINWVNNVPTTAEMQSDSAKTFWIGRTKAERYYDRTGHKVPYIRIIDNIGRFVDPSDKNGDTLLPHGFVDGSLFYYTPSPFEWGLTLNGSLITTNVTVIVRTEPGTYTYGTITDSTTEFALQVVTSSYAPPLSTGRVNTRFDYGSGDTNGYLVIPRAADNQGPHMFAPASRIMASRAVTNNGGVFVGAPSATFNKNGYIEGQEVVFPYASSYYTVTHAAKDVTSTRYYVRSVDSASLWPIPTTTAASDWNKGYTDSEENNSTNGFYIYAASAGANVLRIRTLESYGSLGTSTTDSTRNVPRSTTGWVVECMSQPYRDSYFSATNGIVGVVYSHGGTTTRDFYISLLNPLNQSISNVGYGNCQFRLYNGQRFAAGIDIPYFQALQISTSPTGTPLTGFTGMLNQFIAPIEADDNYGVFYEPNHGFETGDYVKTIDTDLQGGGYSTTNTWPIGMGNNEFSLIEKVDDNRFRLNSTSNAQQNYTYAYGIRQPQEFASTSKLRTTDYIEQFDNAQWPMKSEKFSCINELRQTNYNYFYFPGGSTWNQSGNGNLLAGSTGQITGQVQLATSEIYGNRLSQTTYVGQRVLIYNNDGTPATFTNGEKINDYDLRCYNFDGSGTSNIYFYIVSPAGAPSGWNAITNCLVVMDTGTGMRVSPDQYIGGTEWVQGDHNRLVNQEDSLVGWDVLYYKMRYASGSRGTFGGNEQLMSGYVDSVYTTASTSTPYIRLYNPFQYEAVTRAVRLDGVVTITTAQRHRRSVGDIINVTGNPTTFSVTQAKIIAVTPYTFSYDLNQAGQLNETAVSATYAYWTTTIWNYSGSNTNLETISSITAASPAVMTLSANTYYHGQGGYIFNHQDVWPNPTVNANWNGPEGQPLNTVKVYLYELTATTFELYLDPQMSIPFDTTSYGALTTTGVGPLFWPEGPIIEFAPLSSNIIGRKSNPNANTIQITDANLNPGTLVTYNSGTGDAAAPLSTGATRYVYEPIGDRVKLSTSETGEQDVGRRILHTSYTSNRFRFSSLATDGPEPITGTMVKYINETAPVVGALESGAYYYIRITTSGTTGYFQLYWTKEAALTGDANYLVERVPPYTGGGRIIPVDVVDFTSKGTSIDQTLTTQSQLGVLDGLYTISDNAPVPEGGSIGDRRKFVLGTNVDINKRSIEINPLANIDIKNHAFYSPQHSLFPTTRLVYQNNGNQSISTLVDGQDYYVIKLSNSWFQIALTEEDVHDGVYIELDQSDGTTSAHSFEVPTIVGSVPTSGSLKVSLNSDVVDGTGTSFNSFIKSGDNINWSYPPEETELSFTFNSTSGLCTATGTHRLITGDVVRFAAEILDPTGLVTDQIYYVRDTGTTTFQLHPTYDDAIANTNVIIPAADGTGPFYYKFIQPGNASYGTTYQVLSATKALLFDAVEKDQLHKYKVNQVSITNITTGNVRFYSCTSHPFEVGQSFTIEGTGDGNIDGAAALITSVVNTGIGAYYFDALIDTVIGTATNTYVEQDMFVYVSSNVGLFNVSSALLLRADSASMHRPYDGGVEIVTSSNPQSRMIRQTRKYFRYQSGKGIQVSFAINFSPTVVIDSMSVVTRGDTEVTIKTRNPSKVKVGLKIGIVGDDYDAPVGFNEPDATVTEVIDDYTFKATNLNGFGQATNQPRGKFPEFFAQEWSDCVTRCGLFDDQNGMFWEYDGTTLYAVRRNSTTQLAGYSTVEFNSAEIRGQGTRWLTQLEVGDSIVIKGMTYRVVNLGGNELMYVQPSYRGITSDNVVISVVRDLRVPQDQFSLDPLDGTGPTKTTLDIHTIQMAYIDYSWYGAGKIRFGFKDKNGHVKYVHEFIHGGFEREAYMRSGNVPARYEVATGDNPTFVPSLAHWGTSIIMDGTFDDDKAYLFSASSSKIKTSSSVSVPITFTGRADSSNTAPSDRYYRAYDNKGNYLGDIGYALVVVENVLLEQVGASTEIVGPNIALGTKTANPIDSGVGTSPYLRNIRVGYTASNGKIQTTETDLLVINQIPTNFVTTNSSYTLTQDTNLGKEIPLLSLRLAPSVDNGVPGRLGSREIINRMQLALKTLDILCTHEVTVSLKLNATLDNYDWQNAQDPSLSQVIYHNISDTVTAGLPIFSFKTQNAQTIVNSTTTKRQAQLTEVDLTALSELGNSILGGDGVFPDGPDVVTITAKFSGDVSEVSTGSSATSGAAPFELSTRLSWAESQA